jgi:hypothetical protein
MNEIQNLQPSLAPFARPICPECTSPMFIVTVEPDSSGYEAHTYECPNCKFIETSVLRCLRF